MRVTLLGTGSPLPSRGRASTGHLVETPEQLIIVDCGPGVCRRLLETGVSPADIQTVLISHLHFDHIGDLATLLFYCWDQNAGIRDIPRIYGPPGVRRFVDRLFGREGAFSDDLMARTTHPRSLQIYHKRGGQGARPWPDFEVIEIVDESVLTLPGATVNAARVLHHQPYLESLGYRITADSKVFGYTSDIQIEETVEYERSLNWIGKSADVLVHYFNAFDFDQSDGRSSKARIVATTAEKIGARKLVTTHHGPAMDRDEVRIHVLEAFRAHFRGEAVWGEDGLVFQV